MDVLPQIWSTLPAEAALCLCHNHVLYQFSNRALDRYRALVDELAAERDVYWIASQAEQLVLVSHERGGREEVLLARCGGHGLWLEWLARDGP